MIDIPTRPKITTFMPELPEVETSRRGISPHLLHQRVNAIVIRQPQLRWPIPEGINDLIGQPIIDVARRGKYLLLTTAIGTAILHLGMSGRLRVIPAATAPQKHDHVDFILENQQCLRLTDPRRFGALLWTTADPQHHPLLQHLGPEPLTAAFNGNYLYKITRKRHISIKQLIMDSKIVVGVGNIYANEALFLARIHPERPVQQLNLRQYMLLAEKIKYVLQAAIEQGGTTLRDFQASDGKPGYFKQHLLVYGRGNKPCYHCQKNLTETRINQRTTVFCAYCQKR